MSDEKTKHTPGPWHWSIEDYSLAGLGTGESPGNGTPLVMSVSPCAACSSQVSDRAKMEAVDPTWEWGRCCTPKEADAHLIAAAPELLEALRELVLANEEWNSAVEKIINRPPTWTDGYLDAARAAIAKAEGREVTPK